MAKGFGINPITEQIYYGTQNKEKNMWTGKKEDVTDEVVSIVFEWIVMKFEKKLKGKPEGKCAKITREDSEYELVLKRKTEEQ